MIPLPSLTHKIVAVLGLGLSGRSVCRALIASGARVWAWDDAGERRAAAAAAGVPVVDLEHCNWYRVDRLVLSPGIPLRHPKPHRLVRLARAAGIVICGDIELMVENQPARQVVGVTGTNGKSTTASLIAAVLQGAGMGAQLGGNIGVPVLDLLPGPEHDIYVLELSSYQLDLTEHLHCAVAVSLNITPDHLGRHGGMAGYVQAKRRIFRNQEAEDWAIVGVDDAPGQALYRELAKTRGQHAVPIAIGRALEHGVYVQSGRLHEALDGPAREVADLASCPNLPGAHNWQNAAAAYAAARVLGATPEAILPALRRFAGLRHRLQEVGRIDGVRFINDSKATNPEAAAKALACFERIYWIAGGQPKQDDLDAVLPFLGRVHRAYLIGEAAPLFERLLAGKVECVRAGELAVALDQAAADALADPGPAPVVLLAPACASFDQFANFEARGDAFASLVEALGAPARAAAGGVR